MAFSIDEAYRDHGSVLFWFAVNAVGDRAEAEDLVQETFTRAWRASSTFDPERASLRTWLFAIARNLALDTYRARSRRPLLTDAPLGDGERPEPGPEEHVVRRMQVVEAMARLSPEHREVVAAVHLQGRTYAEVAAATGVGVATLRTRMYYGLRAMRSVLDEAGWSGDE